MGVNIYSCAFCLFKEFSQCFYTVSCCYDPRTFYRTYFYFCWCWFAVGFYMCLLEKIHGFYVHLTSFECEFDEFSCVEVHVGECGVESPLKECIHFRIRVSQFPCMVQVSGYTFDCKKQIILKPCNRRFLTTNTFHSTSSSPCGLGTLVTEHV
ncbi:hypothetical protein DSECCO2_374800 [anaerobic digester metagenome]